MIWKKSFQWTTTIVTVIVLALLITFALVRISVIIGNDLVISLSPPDKSFSIHYPEQANATFTIQSINAALCTPVCSYEFDDMSSGKTVDSGNFRIENGQPVQKSYLLAGKLGSGQSIYNFRVMCANEKQFLCLSQNLNSSRVAFVTLNYEPSEYEQGLKKELRENLSIFLETLSWQDIEVQTLILQVDALGRQMQTANLSQELTALSGDFDTLHLKSENLRTIWHSENYTRLAETFDKSYWNELGNLDGRISAFEEKLNATIYLHNSYLERAKQLYAYSETYRAAMKIALFGNDNYGLGSISSFSTELNNTLAYIPSRAFSDYGELGGKISALEKNSSYLLNYTRYTAAPLFMKGKYIAYSEQDALCILKGICTNHSGIAADEGLIENGTMQDYLNELVQRCDELAAISHENQTIKASGYEANHEFGTLLNFTLNATRTRIQNKYAAEKEALMPNASEIFGTSLEPISGILNETSNPVSNESLRALSPVQIAGGAHIGFMNATTAFNATYCKNLQNMQQARFTVFNISTTENASLPAITVNESHVSQNISDNLPTCCIFGSCRPCCTDCASPELYPVIFLHGHSVDRQVSPEYSLDTLNKLQLALQKDGYLNAGIVSLYSNLSEFQQGEWSRAGVPITVKASYYYDYYYNDSSYILYPEKSENIDTYAVRLKELIDVVKYRTGQQKVIIIAHSMGGLVGRRYIQVFGDEDVDKIVMVATPNHGINQDLLNACTFLGSEKECSDMAQGSEFMRKINDPAKMPKTTRLYTITGIGCNMNSADGDGFVTQASSMLPFAKNYDIKGNCSGIDILHGEMLDIGKYPDVYLDIKEILKE